MDLHPIFVHFPIALLTLYAIFECVRFKKVIDAPHWWHTKAIFLIAGEFFAILAYMTGPDGGQSALKSMHQNFATLAIITFGILAFAYISAWLKPTKLTEFMLRPYIVIPLAIIALIFITITGGLGGAMVYGTQVDPFMVPIFKLLGVY